LGAVSNLAVPYLAIANGVVHVLEELFRVVSRVHNAVIPANQFLPGILADGAEFVVDTGNGAGEVGDGHDRVLIQSKLLIREIFERSFLGDQALLQGLLRQCALGDLGLQGSGAFGHPLFQFCIESIAAVDDESDPGEANQQSTAQDGKQARFYRGEVSFAKQRLRDRPADEAKNQEGGGERLAKQSRSRTLPDQKSVKSPA